MWPAIADTSGWFEALFSAVAAFAVRYCRYLGERDFRFGE